MRTLSYLAKSLLWYRRTNLAVVAGVAIAAAVLGGALLVGHSVRESLRTIALSRLGAADLALVSNQFFRASLADDFHPEFKAAPLIALEGGAIHERTRARASQVAVYGVDQTFFDFHNVKAQAPVDAQAWLSPALAREFNARSGDAILLRLEEPSDIPREFIQGRRDQAARTVRFTLGDVVVAPDLSDFSLRPTQGELRAVFVPLDRLGDALNQPGRANTVLLTGGTEERAVVRLHEEYRLEDLGLRFRDLGQGRGFALEHVSTLIDDQTAAHALSLGKTLGLLQRPVFSWLANSIRTGAAEIPYSLVAGVDDATLAEINGDRAIPQVEGTPIVLNQWAATDLNAKPGDTVTIAYYVWSAEGRLETQSAEFTVASITALSGLAADRTFAPEYPGITDKTTLTSWDPPFPIDLRKIRPRDELYWQLHRATPKAWIPLQAAQQLWRTRYGALTAIRYPEPSLELSRMLRAELDPMDDHFTLLPVRQQAVAAASGSTDFGQYFLYFSFFVIVSALLLMGLFFSLGVEQRRREIGLLYALGFNQAELRSLFLQEGAILALAGSLLGVPLGIGYSAFVLHGLRTWWSGATGTTLLSLYIDWPLLAIGAVSGLLVAIAAVWYTLHRWRDLSPRGLIAGPGRPRHRRVRPWMAGPILGLAFALLIMALSGGLAASAAFFGAGLCLLSGSLVLASCWLQRPGGAIPAEDSRRAAFLLSLRNAAWRPGRSILCLALIAVASFLLVSLESFRHGATPTAGAYTLYAESQAPLVPDPNSESGRDTLNLLNLPETLRWTRFRLRPGDDVSCLNLYQPRNPRVLGVPTSFLHEGSFRFADSVGASPETQANPWLLLETQLNQNVIPAIVDETSLQYVLHKRLGDIVEIPRPGSSPLRFRLVAALRDSLFQGEILISEKAFLRTFPGIEGYRVFLIQGDPSLAPQIEDALSDYAVDVTTTAERLAAYHRVNDTYISTFQALGALGLLLGTLGLAAVLLRNTLERRRELALLRAEGFSRRATSRLLFYEHLALLCGGLALGAVCALIAIGPALTQRGAVLPVLSIAGLLVTIMLVGLAATWLAVRAALHAPLMESLRSE